MAQTPRLPGEGRAALILGLVVLLGVLLRLPGLNTPPLDGHHVRQADTASMARIMARDGLTLWTPRIGWAGPEAGPVESEFPIYTAVVGAGWALLGSEPAWVPRSLSLLAWLLGGLGLYRLVRRRLRDTPSGLLLALYALSPLAVLFSRSIQPDALATALLLWSWERADAAGDGDRPGPKLVLAAVLAGLAIASKGPIACWLPVLAYAAWPGLERLKGRDTLVVVALAVLPPVVWYLRAHQLGADGASFKLWGPGSGKWTSISALASASSWAALARNSVILALSPLASALIVLGVAASHDRPVARVSVAGLAATIAAILALLPAFAAHEYYFLPLLPFASVLAGLGAHRGWRLLQGEGTPAARLVGGASAVALAALTAWTSAQYLQWGWAPDTRIAAIEASVAQVLPMHTALVVVDRHPQTLLYALDQTGWHRERIDLAELRDLRRWGAEALLLTDTSASWDQPGLSRDLLVRHPLVARGQGWSLYRLDVEHGSAPQ